MRECPRNPNLSCASSKDSDCTFCSVPNVQSSMFDFQKFLESGRNNALAKQNDIASVEYINYQVKMGVSLEDCLKNLGYEKKLTTPNCGSHVRVAGAKKEATLSDILTELVKIKEVLVAGKSRRPDNE